MTFFWAFFLARTCLFSVDSDLIRRVAPQTLSRPVECAIVGSAKCIFKKHVQVYAFFTRYVGVMLNRGADYMVWLFGMGMRFVILIPQF